METIDLSKQLGFGPFFLQSPDRLSGFQEKYSPSGGWLTGCEKYCHIQTAIPTDTHHLNPKVITEGRLCTAQGVLLHFGGNGVAFS